MKQKNKTFIIIIVLGSAVVFGWMSTSRGDYIPHENPEQKIIFALKAATTSSISQFEFLGEGDITFIDNDIRNPFKMEGSFKGGWSIFDAGTTRFYGVHDPDGVKDSGDELSFTVCFYDDDLDGKKDLINMRIHDFKNGIRFFDCCQTLQGEIVEINISEL